MNQNLNYSKIHRFLLKFEKSFLQASPVNSDSAILVSAVS